MKNLFSFTTYRHAAAFIKVIILCCSFFGFLSVRAQQIDTASTSVLTPVSIPSTVPVIASPRILSVKNLERPGSKELGLGDFIQVKVDNLNAFYQNQAQDSSIILFLNDIPMIGISPISHYATDNTLTFQLSRDSVARQSWNSFYEYPRHNYNKVRIALGNKSGISTPAFPSNHTLIITPKYSVTISVAFTAVLLGLFLYLIKTTALLRDNSVYKEKGPFSFARTQLAFWTFIIISCYFYIYLTSGELTPITGSTLILLSISTVTAATATFIDTDQSKNRIRHQNQLSAGFFTDIASDDQGVSTHRLQVILWTLILGLAFIRSVIKDLSMPEFHEGLLLLMGISNTAYLSLKTQENQTIQTTPTTPAYADAAIVANVTPVNPALVAQTPFVPSPNGALINSNYLPVSN